MATYIVKKGDNLSTIAKKFGMTEQELMKENNINPNRKYIYSGDAINVIDNRSAEAKAKAPLSEVNNKIEEYIVQKGDNYYTISQKYKISLADLMELNNKARFFDDLILPGDSLKVIDRNHAEKTLANCGHESGSSGKCPARIKIAIVPVRYAIDESSTKNAPALHPIPSDWQPKNTHPNIKTRNYTLRQLRDGWLYVWNATINTLYEYQIQGPNFTLKEKTDAKGKTVAQQAEESGTKKYIEFLGNSKLYLSYSPVKATERVKKELVQHNSKWSRELDLAGFCQGTLQPNTQLISNISHYVADVNSASTKVGDFSTTTLPTQKSASHDTFKSSTTEDALKAAVPNVDDALFIALEDPLAIVDDLTMQLIGRWAEKFAFNEQNEHKIVIANNCLELLDIEQLSAGIPADIKKDPAKYYQCIADINKYYDDIASIDNQEANAGDYQAGEVLANWLFDTRDKIKQPFQEKWHFLPSDKNKNAWKSSSKTRLTNDLRLQEMLNFLADATAKQQALNQHIKNSEADLRVWLDLFNEQILHIYHDNLNAEQTTQLLETVDTVISFLGMSEEGKQWIGQRCANPQTLFALGTANFDQPLYHCIKTVAQELDQKFKANEKTQTPHYATDQWLIDNIAGNDNLGIMRYLNASNSTSVVSRIGEIQSAIDMVKESISFKQLPETSKQALETQRSLTAKGTGHAILQHLEHNTLAAVATDTDLVLTQSILSSARQDKVNGTTINIGQNPDHAWQKKEITRLRNNLNQKIYYRRNRIRQADAGLLTLKAGMRERYLAEIDLFVEQRSKLNLNKAPALFAEVKNNHINEADIKQHSQLADLLSDPSKTPQTTHQGGMPSKIPTPNNQWFAQSQEKLSAWVNNKGGFLPIIVFGFNLYNLKTVNEQAAKNNYDNNAKRELLSAAGYAANAFTALYVMPYWSKYAKMIPLAENGTKLTQLSINAWKTADQLAAAKIATRLASGMAIVSAFALIGASVELYQVYNNDYSTATSGEEKALLGFKMATLVGMTGISSVQLIGAALAPWYAFGWIMSTPIGIAIAVVGVLYLIFSFWSAYYKREGLRLWFYRCTWGRAPHWQNTPIDHKRELHALYKLLWQPTLKVQRTNSYNDRVGFYPLSSWIAIQLPKKLEGNTITLESLLVNGATTPHSQIINGATLDYYQWVAHGHWVAPPAEGSELTLPSINGPDKQGPVSDVVYTTEKSRVWLTKLVYNGEIQQAAQQNSELMIELKITYPDSIFGEPLADQDNSYLFTIPVSSTSDAQGKLETDYYSTTPPSDTLIDKEGTPLYRIYRDANSFQQLEVASAENIEKKPEENIQ